MIIDLHKVKIDSKGIQQYYVALSAKLDDQLDYVVEGLTEMKKEEES